MGQNLNIGVIGGGWMGKAHTLAYKNCSLIFGNEPLKPVLHTIADINIEVAKATAAYGNFKNFTNNWKEVVDNEEIDVIDIVTPNKLHPEIAIAAAKKGKHIYCEKPLANTAKESEPMMLEAEKAGINTIVGFNYLKIPIIEYARNLIKSGKLGEITMFRGTFDQEYQVDPNRPFSWRMSKEDAGTGALGDMASHTLSYALALVGDVEQTIGNMGIFIKERNVASGGSGHTASGTTGEKKRVENEDIVQFLLQFKNGTLGSISASRIATGRMLDIGFEIQGTKGAMYFTNERMNELNLYFLDDEESSKGYRKIYNHPNHRWYKDFNPIPGIPLGYNDQKIIEVRELVESIAEKRPAYPDFRFGWTINKIIDAVDKSVLTKKWEEI